MRTTTITAALAALWLCAAAPARAQDEAANGEGEKKAPAAEAKPAETRQVSLLQAREVIERLKTMRAQLLLEQEYNRLLAVRLERAELETKLGGSKTSAAQAPASAKTPSTAGAAQPEVRANIPPPPRLENATEQLVVKAVTVAPFKEAIVTYRGRVYTVRPGDKLGNIEIRDIVDSGVVTAGGGQKTSVMLGQ